VTNVEVERWVEHPVEEVFRRYTDHAGWTDWVGMGRVYLVAEGSPHRDGVGAVRAFAMSPGLREEVTLFDPPRRMEYRISAGVPLLADHHGEVLFAPQGAGTRITWRVSFRSRVPGLGWILSRALHRLFSRVLSALARDLASRPAPPKRSGNGMHRAARDALTISTRRQLDSSFQSATIAPAPRPQNTRMGMATLRMARRIPNVTTT
jgi:uncharacterized protein YndB with AHSA1/START domain